ncbi:MAG: restriction endonuclease subunit S, partial [Treponemataceae bacterium]
IDENEIIPQYLFLQFTRFEMDRYGWFLSDGSIRSNLDWDRFSDIQIPLPPIEVQKSIVNVYHCIEEAKKIAAEAREKLSGLCPALLQKGIYYDE